MTLSFSNLNEIGNLYESIAASEQEQLDELTSTQAGGGKAAISALVKQGVSPIEAGVRVKRAGEGELNRQSSARTSNQSLQSGKEVNVNTSAGSGLLGKLGLQNQKAKLNSKGELEVQGTNSNFAQDKSLVFGKKGYNRLTSPDGKVKYVPAKGSAPLKLTPQGGGNGGGNGGGGNPPPAAKPVLSMKNGVQGTGSGADFKASKWSSADTARYNSAKAATSAKTLPSKPAIGTTPGGTKFERRTPTRQEMDAAKGAGGGEAGVKAAVAVSKPAATSTLSQATAAASKPQTAFTPKTPAATSSVGSFKPVNSLQATNAAGSTKAPDPATSFSKTTAATPKPITPNPSASTPAGGYSKKEGDGKLRKDPLFEGVDVYDLVLEYLLNNGHVDTVEEANYVMMELDAEVIQDIVEEVLSEDANYDRNRKRAAQRAAARNEARKAGKTGAVPGVGYVSPRPERETYRDAAGVERHTSGAKMPEKKG